MRRNGRQAPLLRHHRDRLSERRAAYRPRLRGDRDRCDRALHAARRLRRLFPHRHRRARHQDAADRGQGEAHAAASWSSATCRASRPWSSGSNCSNDDFIRTTEERHHRVLGGDLGAHGEGRRHLSRQIFRLVLGARRGLLRRGRDDARRQGRSASARTARRSNGWRRRAISSGSPPIRTGCSISTRSIPDFVLPKERLNEVASFVRGGLQDLSISRTTFDWGIKVPGNPEARHVCVGRRADQLHHRRRLSRHRQREIPPLLAGRPARHRQGHRALPRGLLAGLPDVGRDRGAAAHLLATAFCSTAGRRCRSRSAT